MTARSSARVRFSAELLLAPLLVSHALEISYDSTLPSSPFLLLREEKVVQLPQKDTVTLFFFPAADASTMASNYVAALSHCLPRRQLAVYSVTLHPTADVSKDPPPVFPQSRLFEPIIAHMEESATEVIFLIDQGGRVKYAGPLGSPGKFSTLLHRLDLDVRVRQPDVARLLSGNTRVTSVFSARELTASDLHAEKTCKIFLFFLSLCAPCGEYGLVEEILETAKIGPHRNLAVYLIFRHFDQHEAERMRPLFRRYECLDRVYRMQDASPEAERYFLSAHPYIAAFSSDNTFIKAAQGHKMGRWALEKFFRTIGQ